MTKKVAVLQSNYIPWKGYFDLINHVDAFVIYDLVQYTKNDWRNRNQIIAGGKPTWLTIPVRQERLDQRIDETRVADPRWAKKHWRTIEQSYSKSPGFAQFGHSIGDSLMGCANESLLSSVNLKMINMLCSQMEIDTKIISSDEFDLPEDRVDRLVHICEELGAKEYVSGPAARIYLDEGRFHEKGLKVSWYEYDGYPEYAQKSEQYNHFVSVLDLLFCAGSKFRNFMKSL